MTIESAKKFFQKINEDANFRISFSSASTNKEQKQIIKNSGYDFTYEEWQQVLTEVQGDNSTQEFSERELKAIAGAFYAGTLPMNNWFNKMLFFKKIN